MTYHVEILCKERPDDERLHFSLSFATIDDRAAFMMCLDKRMRVVRQYETQVISARDATREVYNTLNECID